MDADVVMGQMRPVLAGLAIVAMMAAGAAAAERVSFAKNQTSTTLSGKVGEGHDYVLAAKAGQTMTVKLKATPDVYFNVMEPGNDTAIVNTSITGDTLWSSGLKKTGDYTVRVYQMRASARKGKNPAYTVTFDIR